MVRPLVNRFPNSGEVAKGAAEDLFEFLKVHLAQAKRVDIAITGGTVGIATLAAASELPFNSLDLSRLHIWWGDERFVSSSSEDRNANQARNAWLRNLDIPVENIHEFPSSDNNLQLGSAASQFDEYFSNLGIEFDLMLMGVGPDGHVASLFPGKSNLDSNQSVIAEPDSPKPPPQRLTFTYRSINSSAEIWFVVAGSDKATAVSVAFGDNPSELPVGRIQGKEKTVWYVDQTAGNLVWGC